MKIVERVWGGYPRISEDPNDLRTGILRQKDDIQEGVQRLGADPDSIRWYPENNTSAFKKRRIQVSDPLGNHYWGYRVIRPVWHQALHDLRQGVINALMVWDLDRLARDPRDLEDAIEVVEHYGAMIVSATASSIDLTTDSGIAMARVMVAMANKSSADTGRRVARKHLANAMEGKPVGGTRPFGWDDDKATIRESEARLVRKAVADAIAGRSLHAIAREWNDAGVTTTKGKPWSHKTVKQYLQNPRLVGHRTHNKAVLKDSHGNPVKGLWEPMLDVLEWDRLQAALDHPDKRSRIPRKGARRYLLTGLVKCGKCSGPMYGNVQYNDRHYYVCQAEHLPMVTISGVATDRLVGRLVVAKMAAESVTTDSPTEWARETELADARGKIDKLMSAFVDGRLSEDVVFPRVQALEREVAEMQNDRKAWLATTLGPVVHAMSAEEWERMETDDQRAFAEKLLDAVLIKPSTKRLGNRIDPERVVPVWKKREGQQGSLVAIG